MEVRDGGTEHSRLVGRFCGDRPSTQRSDDNALYVRYYSNLASPNIGFRAKVKIGEGEKEGDANRMIKTAC